MQEFNVSVEVESQAQTYNEDREDRDELAFDALVDLWHIHLQ